MCSISTTHQSWVNDVNLTLQSDSGEAMGLEINHAQLGSQEGGGQLNHVQQYIAK